jgi:hypothetical protein
LPPGRALNGVLHVRMTPEMLANVALVAKGRGFRSAGDFVRHLILSTIQEEDGHGEGLDSGGNQEAGGIHEESEGGGQEHVGVCLPGPLEGVEGIDADQTAGVVGEDLGEDEKEVRETVATKDISDVQICEAVKAANECHFAHWPYDWLQHWTREPYKVCYRALERAADRGLIQYGSSLRTGWLTEKGEELLKESTNEVPPEAPPED